MKIIEGLFKYGENVVVDIEGSLYKRKVHYADGELFISIDGRKYLKDDFSGSAPFDQAAYILNYMKEKRDRISVVAPKGTKERWKQAASERGTSMNKLILDSVEKEINEK